MSEEVAMMEASAQVISMGRAIADRVAAQHSFPLPQGTLTSVASEIKEKVTTALPHKPAHVSQALCSLVYAGFLERTIALSRAGELSG